jgi:hypothetical protein
MAASVAGPAAGRQRIAGVHDADAVDHHPRRIGPDPRTLVPVRMSLLLLGCRGEASS